MTKLTDTQLIVLSGAAAHGEGAASLPPRMTKAAANKVGSSLVARKLMREIRAKPGLPVWREDEQGRGLVLVILRAGRDAIGVEDTDAQGAEREIFLGSKGASRVKASQTKPARKQQAVSAPEPLPDCSMPREGSKQALIIIMLKKKDGASIDALMEATGWLPHTTRAALTGLRKRGFTIEHAKEEGSTLYRIVAQTKAAA